jgi:D-amino peptidase
MKLYLLWDMEGVSGLFTRDQAWYWEPGVRPETAEEGRRLLIADVNAASAAALAAGADELIVCDTHHGGGNIRLEAMLQDPRITYHERSSRTLPDGTRRFLPGLDRSVDGFLLLGHHAKAGTAGAFLPHANSLAWADFRINGVSVGEIGIEACYAGHWDVPLVLVQGDEAGCREAEAQFPGVVTAPVKRAVHAELATGLAPEEARRLTARRVAEAVERLRAGRQPAPYKPHLPMRVTLRLTTVEEADTLERRSGGRRVDEHTVACRVERQRDILAWTTGAHLAPPGGRPATRASGSVEGR